MPETKTQAHTTESESLKLTEGPWKWHFFGTAGQYGLINAKNERVDMQSFPLREGETFPPDMRLLEASSELLEVVRDLCHWLAENPAGQRDAKEKRRERENHIQAAWERGVNLLARVVEGK